MNSLYKFSAYNSQALYGWGCEEQASAYCDHVNLGRDINVYSFEKIADEAEMLRIDSNGEGVNLSDALQEIRATARE